MEIVGPKITMAEIRIDGFDNRTGIVEKRISE